MGIGKTGLLITVRPKYKRGSIAGWTVMVNHENGLYKPVVTLPTKTEAVHYAALYSEIHGIEYREEKVANNPYSPNENPYVEPATTPGTPDEMLDGPNDPYPTTLDMKTPMTTRPRQMPGGGAKEDEVNVEQPPGTVATKSAIPIVCADCDRRFSVAKVASNLKCVCGSTDLDLDVSEHEFLISWAMKDTGEAGQSLVKAANELDALRWLHLNLPRAQSKTIWKVTEKQAKIVRQAMEGDPPFQYIVQGDQPLGLLPENDQFAVPFSDDSDERGDVSDPAREAPPYEARKFAKQEYQQGSCTVCGDSIYRVVGGSEDGEWRHVSDSRDEDHEAQRAPGSKLDRQEARRKTASTPKLVFNLGGPYGYVYPEGNENMKLGWDLFAGEVEILREDGRSVTVAHGVTSKEKFRQVANEFFEGIFSEGKVAAGFNAWDFAHSQGESLSEGDAYEELHGKLDTKTLYDLRDRNTGVVVYTYVYGGEAKELINSDSRLYATPSVYSPGLSDLASKQAEIAKGIMATNPGMNHRAAMKLAEATIKRFPQMVKANVDESRNWAGQRGMTVMEAGTPIPAGSYPIADVGVGTFLIRLPETGGRAVVRESDVIEGGGVVVVPDNTVTAMKREAFRKTALEVSQLRAGDKIQGPHGVGKVVYVNMAEGYGPSEAGVVTIQFGDTRLNFFEGDDMSDYSMVAPSPWRSQGNRKTADVSPEEAGVSVGDIFVASWGYDQTNVDFFKVVGLTGASARLVEIGHIDADGSHVLPNPNSESSEVITKRIMQGGGDRVYFKIHDSAYAYRWDGRPMYQTPWGFGH